MRAAPGRTADFAPLRRRPASQGGPRAPEAPAARLGRDHGERARVGGRQADGALPELLVHELRTHLARFVDKSAGAYEFTSSDGPPIERNNFRKHVWLPPSVPCFGTLKRVISMSRGIVHRALSMDHFRGRRVRSQWAHPEGTDADEVALDWLAPTSAPAFFPFSIPWVGSVEPHGVQIGQHEAPEEAASVCRT